MTIQLRKTNGVTLLEMLLVLTIIASITVMIVGYIQQKTDEFKRDKTAMQMQMILNAGMEYYLNSNLATPPNNQPQWPTSIAEMQPNYLPTGTINSPWGQSYTVSVNAAGSLFQVTTTIPGATTGDTNAQIIAGRLPLATCTSVSGVAGCPVAGTATVTASVSIPGQNLNNARAVNFGSLYTVNGCVPKPSCPLKMTEEILVVPVSVNGTNDQTGQIPLPAASQNVYPISSFTANAIDLGKSSKGNDCAGNANVQCSWGGTGGGDPGAAGYWRVCLSVTTEKGAVPISTVMGTVMAITRCVPVGEQPGTGIGVW